MPEDPELRRDRELLGRQGSKDYDEAIKIFRSIRDGFQKQQERADDISDYWDMYNCVLNSNQVYNGNATMYVPIFYGAVEAIKTRNLNRLFPSSGRYFNATSSDSGDVNAIVALLEQYVRQTHLRTEVIAALLRNGEIEGQYNLYVDWNTESRWVVSRETIYPRLPGNVGPELSLDVLEPEGVEGITVEEVRNQYPALEVIHDTDILVQPTNANSIKDALYRGGDVTIIRRWTKEQVKAMIDRGDIRRSQGEQLLEIHSRMLNDDPKLIDKNLIDAAGIRGPGKYFQAYETWKIRDTDQGRRLTKSYYGGYDLVLSSRRNPMWNDECQLLSVPVNKLSGSFKGISPASRVAGLQYHANDIANEAADSATYSMLPIIMTDPAKNPRTATMLLNLAAIWEVDPNSTRFAEFPKLWQDGLAIIQADASQVNQTMGVSPGMMTQSTGRPGVRRNQAETALEQNVELLSTDEKASVMEDGILTPMSGLWIDYDHQFRDEELTVRMYGAAGEAANIEKVPILQNTNRIFVAWYGVEQARDAAQRQQVSALLNVAMAPPMQQALSKAGKMLDPAPAIESAFGALLGWREGRKMLVDISAKFAFKPEDENQWLEDKFQVPVHPADDNQKHIQTHMPLLQHPDPLVAGNTRDHINLHMMQQRNQAMMQMQQQMQQAGQGMQPGQGGGGPAPPNPGGGAAGPRPMRGPNGGIHPDQMARAGAVVPPR
jgi:hypothetical protein